MTPDRLYKGFKKRPFRIFHQQTCQDNLRKNYLESHLDAFVNLVCQQSLKSLEHVAPQNPEKDHDWDKDIFPDHAYDMIGNLILLSMDLNRLAGNRSWGVKRLYYAHVGAEDPDFVQELTKEAKNKGFNLRKNAITTLMKSKFNKLTEPLLARTEKDPWDLSFINKRSQHIVERVWLELSKWLKE